MASVELREVTRRFAGGVAALAGLSLKVEDGEFVILVGPSGCGKSTALRLLAGLDTPTSGDILIDGSIVNKVGPGERDIAMVFQNYALYPHMSVYRNLAYGLRQRRTPRREVDERVRRTSRMLDLDELLDRRPAQLSGGQRQRVAMGRALVREPRVFLLDEPLSNLDAKLRSEVRGELKRLHQRLGITTIYVTHDQVEAMTLGDRICVMSAGELQQVGTPDQIYSAPANMFVAGFMGSPPMNLVQVPVTEGRVHWGGIELARIAGTHQQVVVGVRPESLRVTTTEGDAAEAVVDFVETLGSHNLLHVHLGSSGARLPADAQVDVAPGRPIVVQAPPSVSPSTDTRIHLAVDRSAVRLFDVGTGAALPVEDLACPDPAS